MLDNCHSQCRHIQTIQSESEMEWLSPSSLLIPTSLGPGRLAFAVHFHFILAKPHMACAHFESTRWFPWVVYAFIMVNPCVSDEHRVQIDIQSDRGFLQSAKKTGFYTLYPHSVSRLNGRTYSSCTSGVFLVVLSAEFWKHFENLLKYDPAGPR